MKDEFIFPIIGAESKLPIYVVGVGCNLNQHPVSRNNGFPHYQVIYCMQGAGILKVHNDKFKVMAQQVFVLYPDEMHEYYAIEEPWETHWLALNGENIGTIFQSLGFTKSMMFYLCNYISLDDIWKQLILEAKTQYSENGYKCSALAYNFMITLKGLSSLELPLIKDKRMSKLSIILIYIDEHFGNNITMEDLTCCIGVSPQYICKLFNEHLKIRPFEYIAKKRIQESKILLLESRLSETEISSACGFNSLSYFCSIFKKFERITPAEFRKIHCK
ncbi:MAG: transcriptional regulator, AraC family [Anaerocolumna sp.]|jgi:AraC-like DNA-binding protein|nr:transcriptional regulator, AraC family [Anaerocolumna sp.]